MIADYILGLWRFRRLVLLIDIEKLTRRAVGGCIQMWLRVAVGILVVSEAKRIRRKFFRNILLNSTDIYLLLLPVMYFSLYSGLS